MEQSFLSGSFLGFAAPLKTLRVLEKFLSFFMGDFSSFDASHLLA